MAKYQINSIDCWGSFSFENNSFCLSHLNAHEVLFIGNDGTEYRFIVSYGLHCFTKEGTDHNIPVDISDGRETLPVCLERYEASKNIRKIIENLDAPSLRLYEVTHEKHFTISSLNNITGEVEAYKVCLSFYKENRLLRIHVISAYFARTGEGRPAQPVRRKGETLFKVAKDLMRKAKRTSAGPKEVRNRHK